MNQGSGKALNPRMVKKICRIGSMAEKIKDDGSGWAVGAYPGRAWWVLVGHGARVSETGGGHLCHTTD